MYTEMNLARIISNIVADLSRVFLGHQALQDCLVFQESQHLIQVWDLLGHQEKMELLGNQALK